jgi:hypothetical protein
MRPRASMRTPRINRLRRSPSGERCRAQPCTRCRKRRPPGSARECVDWKNTAHRVRPVDTFQDGACAVEVQIQHAAANVVRAVQHANRRCVRHLTSWPSQGPKACTRCIRERRTPTSGTDADAARSGDPGGARGKKGRAQSLATAFTNSREPVGTATVLYDAEPSECAAIAPAVRRASKYDRGVAHVQKKKREKERRFKEVLAVHTRSAVRFNCDCTRPALAFRDHQYFQLATTRLELCNQLCISRALPPRKCHSRDWIDLRSCHRYRRR